MLTIRYAEPGDKPFWFTLDRHISETELDRKIRDKMCYVLLEDDIPAGLLRYNLFWDSTPFCTLLYIAPGHQRRGSGKKLLLHWEAEMKHFGYEWVMVSTQADEDAQHFYRKTGYQDAGALVLNLPQAAQPMELFFVKPL
ncbi:MAG: GNAT family N-acetyltransferase [Lachnospiraceae bacterium]|nr:GNAT family N-acetyltransferase [Lachnospiraceae bacterium]MCM1240100.1 GNAT family N-acetyltransferase [Lachnospiraceae bacterium]